MDDKISKYPPSNDQEMAAEQSIFVGADKNGKRSSVRFPVHLPVRILSGDRELIGTTENISANGVLFRLTEQLSVDAPVEFLLEIPAEVISSDNTAAVHCTGRIVRSYEERPYFFAAAIIDEYRFQ